MPDPVYPNERFQELCRELGARADDVTAHVDRDGRSFALTWVPARKSTPPRLRIATAAGPLTHPPIKDSAPPADLHGGPFRKEALRRIESPGPLTLRPEGAMDRFGKHLGLNREVQIGDAAFDARIYIECDARSELVRAVLADPRVREGVLACLDQGGDPVVLDAEGALSVQVPIKDLSALATPYVLAIFAALGSAADAFPPLYLGPGKGFGRAELLVLVAVLGALIAWPSLYLFDWLWEPLGSDLHVTGALLGGLIWLASIPLLVLALRGRSTSLRDFSVCVIFGTFGLPLASVDLLLLVNGALDPSKAVTHDTKLVSAHTIGGKSTRYYLTLTSWHRGEQSVGVQVSSDDYFRLQHVPAIQVTTRAGLLGWERVTAVGELWTR